MDVYGYEEATNSLLVTIDNQASPELSSKEKVNIAKEMLAEQGINGVKIKYKTIKHNNTNVQNRKNIRR